MKKLLLTLGTAATIVAPMVSVVACTSKTDKIFLITSNDISMELSFENKGYEITFTEFPSGVSQNSIFSKTDPKSWTEKHKKEVIKEEFKNDPLVSADIFPKIKVSGKPIFNKFVLGLSNNASNDIRGFFNSMERLFGFMLMKAKDNGVGLNSEKRTNLVNFINSVYPSYGVKSIEFREDMTKTEFESTFRKYNSFGEEINRIGSLAGVSNDDKQLKLDAYKKTLPTFILGLGEDAVEVDLNNPPAFGSRVMNDRKDFENKINAISKKLGSSVHMDII